MLFVGLGVNVAITRYSAYYSSIGKPDEAKRFTRSAILFLFLFGLALSALNYVLAGFLSSALILRPSFAGYLQETSLYILGSTLLSTVTAAATGWNMMGLASASQVLQGVVKLVAAPALIIAGFGVFGAINGLVLSYLTAGFAGIIALCLLKLRHLPFRPWNLVAELVEMIKFGFPVFVGTLIAGLASYFVTVLLAAIASNAVFGFYQAAANFTIPIALVSTSVGGALFPAFSSLVSTGGDLKTAFNLSVKYVSYLIVPIALFLVASSPVLVPTFSDLFRPSFPLPPAPRLRQPPGRCGPRNTPGLLQRRWQDKAEPLPLPRQLYPNRSAAPLLALQFGLGVNGLIYALLISNVGGLAMGLVLAKRSLSASADLRSLMMILFLPSSRLDCSSSSCILILYVDPAAPARGLRSLLSHPRANSQGHRSRRCGETQTRAG